MEKLQCKACGSISMVPMDVLGDDEENELNASVPEPDQDGDSQTRFYTCHVCGDNWLSVKESYMGDHTVTFVHQMGMSPELKRIAHIEPPEAARSANVDYWEYYLDDEEISAEAWHDKLITRRKVLKSICSN